MNTDQIANSYACVPKTPQFALLLANSVPLIGVLLFGWQVTTILAVYWAETGVIGFYTILRIVKSDTTRDGLLGTAMLFGIKLFFTGFFLIHFGGFMLGHGMFLIAFFAETTTVSQFNFLGVIIAVVGLFISHGISYHQNYVLNDEYQHFTPQMLMVLPYQRIIIMHLVIILAGFSMKFFVGFEVFALVLLVLLKTVVDLGSHWREHAQTPE